MLILINYNICLAESLIDKGLWKTQRKKLLFLAIKAFMLDTVCMDIKDFKNAETNRDYASIKKAN